MGRKRQLEQLSNIAFAVMNLVRLTLCLALRLKALHLFLLSDQANPLPALYFPLSVPKRDQLKTMFLIDG